MHGGVDLKRLLYFALLAAELFVGALLMSSLWMSMLYIPIAVAAVALVAMLSWQAVMLTRASGYEAKRRTLFNIALIMLIPVAVFMATYFCIAVAMVIAFL